MLNTISAVIAAKKTLAAGVAAGVILGGGVAAEASGVTSTVSGHFTADSHVAANPRTDTAIETLAAINGNAHADVGLQTAMGAIADAHANAEADAQAHVAADVDGSASIGEQVSAEARSRVGAMAEFVLDLLGINVDAHSDTTADATVAIGADAGAKSTPGLESATEAVVSADVSEQAEAGISTALNAIGDAQTGVQAQIDGLSTVVVAGANAGAGGELDASSPSGVAAGGSARGSGKLGIGLAIGQ